MTRLLVPLLLLAALAALELSSADGRGKTSAGETEPGLWHSPVAPREAQTWAPSRGAPRVSRSRAPEPPHRHGRVLSVTAYCATGNRTASGLWPREGMAAGNAWPFGTRLHVEGVGVVTVQDRYGWGTELDLFMDSCAAARRFGRQHLRVAVMR